MEQINTVGDYIKKLQEFPEEWPVKVSTQAGGGISIEYREIKGSPVIAIFGSNGGRFGNNPLTEQEYAKSSEEFMRQWNSTHYFYTSIHGDHRMYSGHGLSASCYGQSFDLRVIERMVAEGMIPADKVDIERVRRCQLYL
jgi:hypothetical protein